MIRLKKTNSNYAGLAYIDTMNLTPDNITLGIEGEYWISTCRQKTDQPILVPILPRAREVLAQKLLTELNQ